MCSVDRKFMDKYGVMAYEITVENLTYIKILEELDCDLSRVYLILQEKSAGIAYSYLTAFSE